MLRIPSSDTTLVADKAMWFSLPGLKRKPVLFVNGKLVLSPTTVIKPLKLSNTVPGLIRSECASSTSRKPLLCPGSDFGSLSLYQSGKSLSSKL